MKKFLIYILILTTLLFSLTSCKKEDNMENNNAQVQMVAKVLENDGTLLVDVIKSEYAYGNYIILTNDNTLFYNSNGGKITKLDLTVGDRVKISYSGQVMLSYPPQVVAYVIEVL